MISAFLTNVGPNKISFPGFGIGEFVLDPVAFRIPIPWKEDASHPIMWYGIIITFAMVVAFLIAYRKSKYEGIKSDDMFDVAIFLVIFAMIGARLYYVLMEPQDFKSLRDVISIWNGGLAIYGGVIAGAATIFVFTKIKKIKTAKLMDTAAPALILGQAIGRWGNFCNAEAHGYVTELPWRMGIAHGTWINEECTEAVYGAMRYYHPTFLYESIWNIIGFILIMSFYKKKKYDGQPTLWYLVWYGFGRFFIESLRTDSLYFLEGLLGQTVRTSKLVAALCVIGGTVALIVFGIRARRAKLDAVAYESVYSEKEPIVNAAAYGIKDEIKEDVPSVSAEETSEGKEE